MRYSTLLPLLAALPSALSAPVQPDFTNTTTLPLHYGALVFDHFQALDVFGPMDILNSLFMLYSNASTPHFSVLSKTLEPVTTAMMKGGFGQEIVPTTTFHDYLAGRERGHAVAKKTRHDQKPEIDVLIVPGGGGTRRNMTEEINFVKTLYPSVSPPFLSLPLLASPTN
jgi:putative intracellular protease/amidase